MRAGDHARRAEAALQPVMFAEHLLNDAEAAILVHQTFNGGHIRTIGLRHEYRAGFYRLAVDIDGAGAAMAGFTADMRAGDAQVFPKEMDQQRARFRKAFNLAPVHGQFYVHL
jgi:hypothetical protein